MILLLALHALVGSAVIAFGARLGRRGFALGAVPPAVTLAWLVAVGGGVLDGDPIEQRYSWVEPLGLAVDLRLDGFAMVMVLLVTGIGVAVFGYALRYFAPTGDGLGRLAGLLTLFGGSMLGLVLADNLLLLYVCWELTTITSYLLIGNDHMKAAARAAALQALLVTSAGALAMLGGFVVLGEAAGTYRLSDLLADPPSGTAVDVALVLIAVGAFAKSAQYPFHSWLPGAMAAPTPVSTYLHSATMVKAGVYLIGRMAPVFAATGGWRPLVLTVGATTMVAGGLRALRQNDLKLLLAYGTISQLGFLVVLFGAGTPEAITAGCVLLLAHGAFKASLFMVVGIVDHETGTRDGREIPVLGPGWGLVKVVTAVSLLSMAGIAPFVGFVAKEAAYDSLTGLGFFGGGVLLAVVVAGSVLTFAYAARFWYLTFVDPARASRPLCEHRPAFSFVAPALVLAAASVLLGAAPVVLDPIIDEAAEALDPAVPTVHLALWHGLNTALLLSAVTIAVGIALLPLRARLAVLLARGHVVPSADRAYAALLRGVNAFANVVTGVAQSGSLPVYAGVTLLTAAALPGAALLIWGDVPDRPVFVDVWAHVPIAIVLVASALGAAIVRRRFAAALFLGTTGYAMAALFVVQGAPDLALTQTAIETLSTVLFVLVLRRLPDRFERVRMPGARLVRAFVAVAVGATVFAFALYASADRAPTADGTTVSEQMVERSLPDGHGRNVVNVILVDFRGFDTLGEITVLAAAAIGAVALARAGRRPLAPGEAPPPKVRVERLVFLDVSVRVIFHAVMVGSLWLLFAGHNQPGGGFAGGLLAGAAMALRYIAGGIDEVRSHARVRPWTFLGTGLTLSAVTAIAPLLFGREVLESSLLSLDLPLLGAVKVTSALPFDVGVYLVVLGLALMVFEAFGDDPPADPRAPHLGIETDS